MAKFVYLYRGGNVPENLRAKNMDDWSAWVKEMNDKDVMIDAGAPLSGGQVVSLASGTREFSWDSDSRVGGYSVVKAGNIDEAVALTEGCPHLAQEYGSGTIEVREYIEVVM